MAGKIDIKFEAGLEKKNKIRQIVVNLISNKIIRAEFRPNYVR